MRLRAKINSIEVIAYVLGAIAYLSSVIAVLNDYLPIKEFGTYAPGSVRFMNAALRGLNEISTKRYVGITRAYSLATIL